MTNLGEHLVRDFLASARHFAARDAEEAMWCLLPAGLAPEPRVNVMVTVGALLTGRMSDISGSAGSAAGSLAAQLTEAGAQRDLCALQDLIAAQDAEALVDVLVELVAVFTLRVLS